MFLTTKLLFPLLFLTLSVQLTHMQALIPRSTILSAMKTSSHPQEIAQFLLSASVCHIILLLHSSWILLSSCPLDNTASCLQCFRQWKSKPFLPYSLHEDFHVHNQLNLWIPVTVFVVCAPDNLNPNRNPGCVSNFYKKYPFFKVFVFKAT